MQTDMLIFQDINNGFLGVVENGKSIRSLEKTDKLTKEGDAFLSAFAGLLNEQIKAVLEGRTSLKHHDEKIESLYGEDVQDEESASGINKKKTCEGCFIFSVSGFSKLEIPATDKSEMINFGENKTEFSEDIKDSKTGVLIAQLDVEDAEFSIKSNMAQADGIKLDRTGTDASEKANIKSIDNPPELLSLKNGHELSSKKKNLPEAFRQSQAEAGIDVVKKDIADQDQSIKKHDQIFFQKKETPFGGFEERFDDKSGSREDFNRKEFLGKLEVKAAPAQNGFNKAPFQGEKDAGVNYASEAASKIAEPVFTQMEELKNKDPNISKVQVGGENKEAGHILFKSHFSENPAGVVKGDEPAQKPAAMEVLSQIIDKAVLTLRKGQNEMRISLKPDSLGHLNLKIVTDNHHVMVKVMADNLHVKELIENNLHHLKGELSSHGLEIDKFDVLVAEDSYGNGGRERNNEFFKMKNGKHADRDSKDKVTDEPEALARIMKNESGTNLVGVFA
jgi:hypothetical protein